MKRIVSILILMMLLAAFSQDANAYGWGRWHNGWRRPFYAAPYVPVPIPRPYVRPYYAPPPGVRGPWVPPHWRRGPYGDQWVPGHYARPRGY